MSGKPPYAWLNGELVAWDDCVVHARSQGAFWGANVFEGLRGYAHDEQVSLFRVGDHLRRLHRSARSLHLPLRYTDEEITEACRELLRANEYHCDVHLCVVAYFGTGPNFDPLSWTDDAGMHITTTRAPRSPGFTTGVTASVSSWRRISDDAMPSRIKTGANYHNSRLAQHEAARNGFATTLLLNQRGSVSEAPGACVMMYREGRLVTPPGTSGVLEGITLATVAELAELAGIPVERREIDRAELYAAEELFLCGTLAEILPIVSIDRIAVGTGAPGEVTRLLQDRFDTVARHGGGDPAWSTPVFRTPVH